MALLAAVCSGQAQNGEEYYVKHLDFPQGATLQEKVDMAARLVPTPQQLAWQQMESGTERLSTFLSDETSHPPLIFSRMR